MRSSTSSCKHAHVASRVLTSLVQSVETLAQTVKIASDRRKLTVHLVAELHELLL